MPSLELEDVSKSFRGLRAVSGATFAVDAGTIVALIGPMQVVGRVLLMVGQQHITTIQLGALVYFAFPIAMSSWSVFAFTDGCANMMFGLTPALMIGAKSLKGS